jgi:nucleolar protein 56
MLFGGAGIMTDELRNFLELNLPKVKDAKKAKFTVGVMEPKVGSHITEATGIKCQSNEYVQELLRAVRLHFDQFIDQLKVMVSLHSRLFVNIVHCIAV